jgi:hypothetical protein
MATLDEIRQEKQRISERQFRISRHRPQDRRMISAVGRFPPLPQWFQGVAMPFEFGFPFPEALQE